MRADLTLLRAVHKRRLYRRIADQLSAFIAIGNLKPGERLPSERDLARELGVSRPSLREALIWLQVERRVEVRDGSGIFVIAPKPIALPVLFGERHLPIEVLGARYIVEGEVAALAARERTSDDLTAIRQSFDAIRKAGSLGLGRDSQHREFHLAIAAATHNGALMAVIRDLWDAESRPRGKRGKQEVMSPLLGATLGDYRRIVDALDASDASGARAAMRRHLKRVAREYARNARSWQRSGRALQASMRF